jgi:hypothetical protein
MFIGTYKINQAKIYLPSIWLKSNKDVKEVDVFIDDNIITIKPASVDKTLTKIKDAQEIKQIENFEINSKDELMDLALFSFMNVFMNDVVGIPTYAQIRTFFTSLHIQAEKVAITVLRGLQSNTICIHEQPQDEYGIFLEFLLKWLPPGLVNFQLPHTFSIQEAFSQFSGLGFKDIHGFVAFLERISTMYPDVLGFSSEKLGHVANLVTIRNVFSEKLLFARDDAWKVN